MYHRKQKCHCIWRVRSSIIYDFNYRINVSNFLIISNLYKTHMIRKKGILMKLWFCDTWPKKYRYIYKRYIYVAKEKLIVCKKKRSFEHNNIIVLYDITKRIVYFMWKKIFSYLFCDTYLRITENIGRKYYRIGWNCKMRNTEHRGLL